MIVPRIVIESVLTPAEMGEAKHYARLRREHHRGPLPRGTDPPWDELMGTLGEMGVAKAFGLLDYWTDNAAYKLQNWKQIPADVGRNVQVRTVDRPAHKLAVRKTDPLDAPYVACLVVPEHPETVLLLGWAWGQYVADNGRWMSEWPRPAWAIPVNINDDTRGHIKCMTAFPEEELR